MSNVVVLDNGGGLIKAGQGGERDPAVVIPNCLYRPLTSKKFLHPSTTTEEDLTSAAIRRPIDRGYLINPDLQRDIWSHLFNSLLHVSPSSSSLLLTEPLFSLPSIQRSTDELIFEDFGFNSLFVADSPSLVHLYESSRRPDSLLSEAQCSLVVDCGFSFTHVAPVFQNCTLNYGVKRIDLGGKAFTNYLKELVSYRSINVMDETFLMDDVKEKLCFVSLDVETDLQIARKQGKDNLFRCTYVLPDGVTHKKGYVEDPEAAQRHLRASPSAAMEPNKEAYRLETIAKTEERKRVDLTKNEFDLMNERFLVPEMIFQPADLGMNEAGLAECIVRAVNSCHPYLRPHYIDRWKYIVSSICRKTVSLIPGPLDCINPNLRDDTVIYSHSDILNFRQKDLRPLVPHEYQVKITTQNDPILDVWRGGSLLASSPNFESTCVTKAEYEEHGSARCRRRFFH
ncbi:hypothetical protein GOBAR_AA08029 [Gossypium barbadense]|uniref:Actin-related protein 6 n=1 Tax=Gossypium barbadense TaxID=3634 RepID=A0A2P5YAK8_GOSBA|nr:hypothetical protein GOBAR_AA08029 [Gossypium barbadense]